MVRRRRRLLAPVVLVMAVAGCTQTVPTAAPSSRPTASTVAPLTIATTSTTTTRSTTPPPTSTSTTLAAVTTTAITTPVIPLDTVAPTTVVPLTAVEAAEIVIDEGRPMTLRLPVAPGHPSFDSIVTSWWAIERATFERRATAHERARAAEEAAARAALEAEAAARAAEAATSTVPPGDSTTTSTTTTTTTVPPTPPAFYVDHDDLVVGEQASMIRLRTAAVFDDTPQFAATTFYAFEDGAVLPGLALVEPARRRELVDWLALIVGDRAAAWADAPTDELLADVELAGDGRLRIGLPTRWLTPGPPLDPIALEVGATDAFLSELGRAVRDDADVDPGGAEPADCTVDACVALTFDDGPVAATEQLLNILGATRTPATFFVLGPLVERHPDLAARIVADGHELGNHGWSHDSLAAMSAEQQHDEIARTDAAIAAATGTTPTLLRPPYGRYDDDTRWLDDTIVLWDVDTRDWQHRDPARTAAAVVSQVDRGSIVLLHDLHATTIAAVPMIVARLHADGYRLVTVSELLGPTEPGAVYRSRDDHDPAPPPTTTTTTTSTTTTLPASDGG